MVLLGNSIYELFQLCLVRLGAHDLVHAPDHELELVQLCHVYLQLVFEA